ncbi:unnamed protein product [Boreogadus saida]
MAAAVQLSDKVYINKVYINTDYISEEEERKVEGMLAFLTEESKQAAASTATDQYRCELLRYTTPEPSGVVVPGEVDNTTEMELTGRRWVGVGEGEGGWGGRTTERGGGEGGQEGRGGGREEDGRGREEGREDHREEGEEEEVEERLDGEGGEE